MLRFKSNILLILSISFSTIVIIFLLSYIIGVVILQDTLPGSPYYGALFYYFKVAIIVIILIPHLNYKRVKDLLIIDLIVVSVGSGILFTILSKIIHDIYLRYIQYLKSKITFSLLESFSLEQNIFVYLGIVLTISLFMFGYSIKRSAIENQNKALSFQDRKTDT